MRIVSPSVMLKSFLLMLERVYFGVFVEGDVEGWEIKSRLSDDGTLFSQIPETAATMAISTNAASFVCILPPKR
jgi:hypothetical protein